MLDEYMRTKPLVSIGLPVYNGQDYVNKAIASLVNQSYPNIEIIVSDNGSTDRTKSICEIYAKKYETVKYYRYNKNRGIGWNRNNTFHLSKGDYFLWFSHDDILHEDYVSECLKIHQSDPTLSVVYSKSSVIDSNDAIIPQNEIELRLDSENIKKRFGMCLSPMDYSHSVIFGVIERKTLLQTNLMGDYLGADRSLVAKLSLYGKIYQIPKYLFFRRKHEKNIGATLKDMEIYKPEEKISYVFPQWRVCFEHVKSVFGSPHGMDVKFDLLIVMLRWWLKNRKEFRYELTSNLKRFLQSLVRNAAG